MGTSAKLVSAARTPAVGPGARGTREVRDRTLEITVFLMQLLRILRWHWQKSNTCNYRSLASILAAFEGRRSS